MTNNRLNTILQEVEDVINQDKGTSCATQALVDTDFLARSISVIHFSEPVTCSPDASVEHASSLLQLNSVGCVIIETEEGNIAGVFSERDFMTRVLNKKLDLEHTTVQTVMTPEPTTVYPDDTIAYCLSLMSLGGFRHLPVVDRDMVPIGILSMQDVVNGLVDRILATCAN